VVYYLVYAFIIIGTLDPTNVRGVTLFNALVEHVAEAILDLDVGTAMPSRHSREADGGRASKSQEVRQSPNRSWPLLARS
jgi:hypothetical protein